MKPMMELGGLYYSNRAFSVKPQTSAKLYFILTLVKGVDPAPNLLSD